MANKKTFKSELGKRDYLTQYGFCGLLKLVISKIFTLSFVPDARLIRLPVDIRFRKNICWGHNLTTGFGCRIEAYNFKGGKPQKTLHFGDNVEIGDYVHIAAGNNISIGNNVLMASKIFITDMLHGNYSDEKNDTPFSEPNSRMISFKDVLIGDNVWIGEAVTILPGVSIGNGSVIGANSVVTRNVAEHTIAVGNPAHEIKKYNTVTGKWESIKMDRIL